jgi:hypothetical protein
VAADQLTASLMPHNERPAAPALAFSTDFGTSPSRASRKFEAWLKGADQSYEANVIRTIEERDIKVIARD